VSILEIPLLNYNYYSQFLKGREKQNFQYFTQKFGGGFSGELLKSRSLELCKIANHTLTQLNTKDEFIVIRTGGISTKEDIQESFEIKFYSINGFGIF